MTDPRTGAAVCLERTGELIRAATPPASLQQHLEGRARLIAAVEKMRKPHRWGRMRPAAAIVFVAVTSAAILAVRLRGHVPSTPAAPLAWQLENGDVGAQGYVSIPPAAPTARLVFDDGSNVALAPGSSGRVAATTAVGAEVVLEHGRANVHVAHHEHSSWLVDAGPFAVRVTGTDFLVAWAADTETLDVWMHTGHVVVRGPVLGDAQPLGAGQHLQARLRDATVLIDSAPEPADSLSSLASHPPPSLNAVPTEAAHFPPVGEPGAASPQLLATSSPVSAWSTFVASGNFRRVVKEAENEGVSHALNARPLSDLRALGDAARYANNGPVAKRAYLAVRARFPSGSDAHTAAFLLGRLAEEQDHAAAEAMRWYDKYLAEAPGGEFAGNALGRKMLIVSKAQGRETARTIAERYLQHFPNGPYEAAARDLAP